MRTPRFIVTFTLTVLALGLGQTGTAAWDQAAEAEAGGSGPLLLVQAPGGPPATFSGRPEFPPPGYLAEFEESPWERRQRESGEGNRTTRPGSPGMPPAPRSPESEYAPGSFGAAPPGSRAQQGGRSALAPEGSWDRREPSGGRPSWDEPSSTPLRERPRHGEPPGMVPPGARPGRNEFPAPETRRRPPSAAAGGGFEHQWPSPPSAGGSYQTHPEFRPDTRDRRRPANASERFRSPPEFPGTGLEWQR